MDNIGNLRETQDGGSLLRVCTRVDRFSYVCFMDNPLRVVLKRNKARVVLGVVLFWLVVGGMIYLTEEVIAANYFGTKSLDRIEKLQYLVRWFIWPLLTPLIILLALKIDFRRHYIARFVLTHMAMGTGILCLEYLIEISIIKLVVWKIYAQHIPIKDYTIPFLFKYWAYISIYFLIVGIVNVFVYIHKYQQSETSLIEKDLHNQQLAHELTLAQLSALKMQLQPHFLFNTHHAIISLMMQKEHEKAVAMLLKLSELLRLTINQSEAPTITLYDETRYMKLYLDIQQVRFQDRLRIGFDIPDNLQDFKVPTFILQPLIENAITHGIAPYADAGLILVSAERQAGSVRICVADDGHGVRHPNPEGLGLGIRNTKTRLKHLYGDAQTFSLLPNAYGGITSTIEIQIS